MKMVIDKDKEIQKLKDMLSNLTDKKDIQSVKFAINVIEGIDGTPFPKNHGRLIDLDALIEKEMFGGYMEIKEKDICNIPVIIKGTENGKWLVDDGLRKIYKCPECGQIVMTNDIEVYRFCHGCGMKMEGVKYEQTE